MKSIFGKGQHIVLDEKQIDQSIEKKRQELEQLKSQRSALASAKADARRISQQVEEIAAKHGVDPYVIAFGDESSAVSWFRDMLKKEQGTKLVRDIKFAVSTTGSSRQVSQRKEPPGLMTGQYTNPHSGQTVCKRRRAPKVLMDWIDQYGIDDVKSWHSNGT
jgi:hypothetical protein